ncbi:unnamed protein product, partial [Sphagnum tenellum]
SNSKNGNWPGQSDSENGNWPGQSGLTTHPSPPQGTRLLTPTNSFLGRIDECIPEILPHHL